MTCRQSILLAGAFCLGLVSTPVNATTFIMHNFDAGWYREDGQGPGSTGFPAGYAPLNDVVLNNFVVFDLVLLAPQLLAGQTVTSANLTFFANNSGNYESPDPSETYVLYDYSGDRSELLLGTGGVDAFTD